jgi:hypothetical protein
MSSTFLDQQGRTRTLTNDVMTRLQSSNDGKSYEMTPRFDVGGKLINGAGLAPSVAMKYGYTAPKMTPAQQGATAGRQAAEFRKAELEAQAQVLGGGPSGLDGTIGASAKNAVRKSPLSNGATLDQKIEDNALGSHLGADGSPATWNTPKEVSGSFGGSRMYVGSDATKGDKGIPDGHGVIGGAGGTFLVSTPQGMVKNEAGGNRRFASMDEVNGFFAGTKPGAAAPGKAPAMVNRPGDEPDVAGEPDENDAYLKSGAGGEAAPAMNGPAGAWAGQGGMMPRPPTLANPTPGLPSAAEVQASPGSMGGEGAGVRAMAEDATRAKPSPAVQAAFLPAAPQPAPAAPSVFNPFVAAGLTQAAVKTPPVVMADSPPPVLRPDAPPVMQADAAPVLQPDSIQPRRKNGMPGYTYDGPTDAVPPHLQTNPNPLEAAKRLWAKGTKNAVWNTPVNGQTLQRPGRSQPYQAAADRFNPPATRNRRTTVILPE